MMKDAHDGIHHFALDSYPLILIVPNAHLGKRLEGLGCCTEALVLPNMAGNALQQHCHLPNNVVALLYARRDTYTKQEQVDSLGSSCSAP